MDFIDTIPDGDFVLIRGTATRLRAATLIRMFGNLTKVHLGQVIHYIIRYTTKDF